MDIASIAATQQEEHYTYWLKITLSPKLDGVTGPGLHKDGLLSCKII